MVGPNTTTMTTAVWLEAGRLRKPPFTMLPCLLLLWIAVESSDNGFVNNCTASSFGEWTELTEWQDEAYYYLLVRAIKPKKEILSHF